jgi:hypothetical protein
MSASTNAPATVEIRHSRLLVLVLGVAATAAAITWVLTAYVADDTAQRSVSAPTAASSPKPSAAQPADAVASAGAGTWGVTASKRKGMLSSLTPQERQYLRAMTAVCSVVMCPPNQGLAAMVGLRPHK